MIGYTGIDAEYRECRWCGSQFTVDPHRPSRRPDYCSEECRRQSHRLSERERHKMLAEHRICPRCKQSIP